MNKQENKNMYAAMARLSIIIERNVSAAYPSNTSEALSALVEYIQTIIEEANSNTNTTS